MSNDLDFDRGLIASVLKNGFNPFLDVGGNADMLQHPYSEIFKFIVRHFDEHGKCPDVRTVRNVTRMDFGDVPNEPVSFWSERILERFVYNNIHKELFEIIKMMDERKVKDAVAHIKSMAMSLETGLTNAGRVNSFFDTRLILEHYAKVKAGITGVHTPFPSLTERTRGFQPEELIVICARMGVGKTLMLLLFLLKAYQTGKKVLLVSTEMSDTSMMLRGVAFQTKMPYGKLRKGQLSSLEENIFRKKLREIDDPQRFLIMGGGFDVSVENIGMAIMQHKPDIIGIDGAYLLQSAQIKAKDRFGRIGEIFDLLKATAKKMKVPVLVTSQINRGGKDAKKQKVDMERLAFSDNIGMVADYVFFLNKKEGDESEKRKMVLEMGKMRESDCFDDIEVNWDFENMNFSEVGREDDEILVKKDVNYFDNSFSESEIPPDSDDFK